MFLLAISRCEIRHEILLAPKTVADPGFPVGGRGPRRGGVDSRGGYISKNFYVKMKEFGPLGGGACAGHAPSRSANVYDVLYLLKVHSHRALAATLQIGYKAHSLYSISGNANANANAWCEWSNLTLKYP